MRSSLTQTARHPVTCMLITCTVPSTPVFGSAEESVDEAPTHQTLPDEPVEESLGGPWTGGARVAYAPAPTNTAATIRIATITNVGLMECVIRQECI